MNELQRAIARLRSLLEPPTRFTTGTKIYEPDKDDPAYRLKMEINSLAIRTTEAFERSPSARTEKTALLSETKQCRERVSSDVAGPEKGAYRELLTAVDELIALSGRD